MRHARDRLEIPVIEDTFSDDSGGWEMLDMAVQPPELIMTIKTSSISNSSLNTTFNATEGDYCVEVVLPAPPAPDNPASVGLVFLASDFQNYYLAQISSDGYVSLFKKITDKWTTIHSAKDSQSVDTNPGAVNAVRVTVKSGRISLEVNGKPVKTVRAQIPSTPQRFGMYVQVLQKLEKDIAFRFVSYKVSTAP